MNPDQGNGQHTYYGNMNGLRADRVIPHGHNVALCTSKSRRAVIDAVMSTNSQFAILRNLASFAPTMTFSQQGLLSMSPHELQALATSIEALHLFRVSLVETNSFVSLSA